jgi:hypothetical protein
MQLEIREFVKDYWNYYLELEAQFKGTQRYVAFDKCNKGTCSVEYLKLIQAVCSEIDVVAKEIARYFEPDRSCDSIAKWGSVISKHMPDLSNIEVRFDGDEVVKPWDGFGYEPYQNAKGVLRYRLKKNCRSLSWWQDYNKIKHSRTTRDESGNANFTRANLNNMILSFSALYALEMIFMDEITPEMGPDCEILESKLFC